MNIYMNYPGLQAGDGGKDLIKWALAQNSVRGYLVIRLVFRAKAPQNTFYLSTPA